MNGHRFKSEQNTATNGGVTSHMNGNGLGHDEHDDHGENNEMMMSQEDEYDDEDDEAAIPNENEYPSVNGAGNVAAYQKIIINNNKNTNNSIISNNSSFAFGDGNGVSTANGGEENIPKKTESIMLTDHDGHSFEAVYLVSNGPGTGSGSLNYSLNTTTTTSSSGGKKKMFYCQTCPYKTNNYCNLKQHLVQHRFRDGFFKCRYCPYYVSMIRLLKQHEVLHGEYEPRDNIKRELPLSPTQLSLIQQQQAQQSRMIAAAAAGSSFSFPK